MPRRLAWTTRRAHTRAWIRLRAGRPAPARPSALLCGPNAQIRRRVCQGNDPRPPDLVAEAMAAFVAGGGEPAAGAAAAALVDAAVGGVEDGAGFFAAQPPQLPDFLAGSAGFEQA